MKTHSVASVNNQLTDASETNYCLCLVVLIFSSSSTFIWAIQNRSLLVIVSPPPLKCIATLFLVLFETLGPGLNAVVRNEDRAKEEDFFFK